MKRVYNINTAVFNLGLSRYRMQEAYFEVTQMLAAWAACEIEREEALEKLSTFGVAASDDIDEDLLLLAGALHSAWKTQGK